MEVRTRFCPGFCEKRFVERGFSMVRSWWFVVSLWLVDSAVCGGEKSDRVLRFIFVRRTPRRVAAEFAWALFEGGE